MRMNDLNNRDHELDKRLAVMEERMNTLKAENETAFERLRSDMARRDVETANRDAEKETAFERLCSDMARRDVETANRDKEAARRETVNTRWIMASILAAAGLIVIILGFMLRLPVAS